MSKIFVDQTSLRIILTTGVVIPSEAITKEIRYRKPDGTTGSLTATVQDPVNGILYYDLTLNSTLLDQEGEWSFWSYVVFSDGRKARGETVVETIWNAEE
jgi:hypothetical protein